MLAHASPQFTCNTFHSVINFFTVSVYLLSDCLKKFSEKKIQLIKYYWKRHKIYYIYETFCYIYFYALIISFWKNSIHSAPLLSNSETHKPSVCHKSCDRYIQTFFGSNRLQNTIHFNCIPFVFKPNFRFNSFRPKPVWSSNGFERRSSLSVRVSRVSGLSGPLVLSVIYSALKTSKLMAIITAKCISVAMSLPYLPLRTQNRN